MITLLLFLLRRKDGKEMAVIYATLIIKGKKEWKEVPVKLQDQVKQMLIDLECGDVAV